MASVPCSRCIGTLAQLPLSETFTGMSTARVHKAVFPVAGMGTRFLPAIKASPKEMQPVVDKLRISHREVCAEFRMCLEPGALPEISGRQTSCFESARTLYLVFSRWENSCKANSGS